MATSIAAVLPDAGAGDDVREVPLSGVREEFRTALREEIEAARRAASSGAVSLVNGRRIAQVGAAFQYSFTVENALNLPGDAPGDLVLPGRAPLDVMVIAVEGLVILLSVPVDLGDFVPSARLRSNMTQLMRRLITRIEELGDGPNPAGERIRGAEPVKGTPGAVSVPGLNQGQRDAVASVLGRDTTFIWGPPGTGKTRTIGAIGDKLFAAGRSLLLVSHTNTAVDQALVKIGEALFESAPDALASGKVLRVGVPADPRLAGWADLLCSTHVERRSEELAGRRGQLVLERVGLAEEALLLSQRIDMCEWVRDAGPDLIVMDAELASLIHLETERDAAVQRHSHLAEAEGHWLSARAAATAAQHQQEALATARERLLRCQAAHGEAVAANTLAEARRIEAQTLLELASALEPDRRRVDELPDLDKQRQATADAITALEEATSAQAEAATVLADAQALLSETESVGALARRWRRLPNPEEQAVTVEACRAASEQTVAAVSDAESHSRAATIMLTEIESLAAKLGPHHAVPRMAAQVASAEAALQAHLAASRRAEELAASLEDASTAAGELTTAVTTFLEAYSAEPADVLASALAHEGELTDATAAAASLDFDATNRRSEFESLLRDRLLALREWQLTDERAGAADTMLAAVRRAYESARTMTAGTSIPGLRSERDGVNDQIRAVDSEIGEIDEALKRVEELVISEAAIVATTLTRAYLRDAIQRRRFDTVILDEASMAPIPALWVAASLADTNVVAVGDFKQLPPIVQSRHELAERWLGRDIFEAHGITDHRGAPDHLVALTEQFRMHPDISGIVNTLIYDELLTDAEAVAAAPLPGWYDRNWPHDSPVLLVDTGTVGAWVTSVARGDGASRLNFLSATICADIAEQILAPDRDPTAVGAAARILVVSPYRPHAKLVELLLAEQGLALDVRSGTVHTFQGSEADVVILDLVNDEPHWRVGMFNPQQDDSTRRLLNVALTRARHRLIVVGDFTYISAQAKRAFIGAQLIPTLRERHPIVNALDVVPRGLAGRAAAAQSLVASGPVEADQDRLVVTQDDFFPYFGADLAGARSRAVVFSPFMTANRLALLEPQLRAAVERGVPVYVVTKALGDRSKRDADSYRGLERALRSWGITVIHKRHMHEKLAFIDDEILWTGSLNPLSFSDTQEVMERRHSRRVVTDYTRTLRLDDLLAEFPSAVPPSCPICQGEIVASEGTRDPWFWRCAQDGCYRRNIDAPPLTDGRLVCQSCSGPVEWGEWGDDWAWRCTANRRHHQTVIASHLRLPAMRALVPKATLRKLDRELGIAPPPMAPR